MNGRGRWARPSAAERLWAMVEPEPNSGCYLYLGPLNESGYGRFWMNGRTVAAHRAAYEIHSGHRLQDEEVARHKCDVSFCVRGEHVLPGTQADNIADRDARGHTARGASAGGAKLTAEQVRAIRDRYRPYFVTRRQLAAEYGVSVSAIDSVLDGETWNVATREEQPA